MNLLIGKRQIVLAALVVTLSLAVFVNWYYTNGDTVISPEGDVQTEAPAENNAPGEALFVNADDNSPQELDAPGDVTTGASEQTTETLPAETEIGDAVQEVDAPQPQTATETSPQAIIPDVSEGGEYFASARLSRTNAFDESVETLQQIIESNDGNSEAAVNAADKISAITAVLQLETSIEALITAKTGSECIAVISDKSVSIVVENDKITDEMILGIHGVLSDNSLTMENITITGC